MQGNSCSKQLKSVMFRQSEELMHLPRPRELTRKKLGAWGSFPWPPFLCWRLWGLQIFQIVETAVSEEPCSLAELGATISSIPQGIPGAFSTGTVAAACRDLSDWWCHVILNCNWNLVSLWLLIRMKVVFLLAIITHSTLSILVTGIMWLLLCFANTWHSQGISFTKI